MDVKGKWNSLFRYEDGFLYWEVDANNNGANKGDLAGFIQNTGYVNVRYDGVVYSYARIIWEMHNGAIANNLDIDHADGNRLNNEIENLRLASRSQNLQNRAKYKKTSNSHSQYKGVSRATNGAEWRAAIYPHGKTLWLGVFSTEEGAARAYDDAARQYYGEFAKTNFELLGVK